MSPARPSVARAHVGRVAPLALFLIFVGAAAAPTEFARASQVQIVPSQGQAPPSTPSAPTLHRQPGENAVPVLPGGQGSNTREIPLPKIFHGCWRGTVRQVDSLEQLDTSSGGIQWLTKSYTLCYEQIGAAHWKLTFAEGSVAERWRVTDERQHIEVKTVDGPNHAHLVAYLHFRAPQVNAFTGMSTGQINTMDELTHLECNIVPGGNVMQVRAQVFVENDERPYAEIGWHTDFLRNRAATD